jgi:SPP1 gp7 family putative phage head morphogenesis protein
MLSQLSQAYKTIERSLNLQLRELLRDIEAAQKKGITVNQDWLRRSFRYQQLINQVKGQISGYSNGVNQFIRAKQSQAIDLGQFHAQQLIESADVGISFARLPTAAIEELIGVMQNGSPLSKVLDKLAPGVAKDIKNTLLTGLASGQGAAKIARDIRSVIDVPRWKALRLARTETLRAYRQSALSTYAQNDDVVSGWRWLSARSLTTCAGCWAADGTFFPNSKQFFPAHPACRCSPVPEIRGVKTNMQSGSTVFGNLAAEQQRAILGEARYIMYANGEATLEDFAILTRDKDWGGAYQVRPLYKLKSRKKAA